MLTNQISYMEEEHQGHVEKIMIENERKTAILIAKIDELHKQLLGKEEKEQKLLQELLASKEQSLK